MTNETITNIQDKVQAKDAPQSAARRWRWSHQATGYLMIAPAIIFLIVVIVYPLFDVLRLSFFEFAGLRAQTATFVGLKHYGCISQIVSTNVRDQGQSLSNCDDLS